jgi:hypothetical protein
MDDKDDLDDNEKGIKETEPDIDAEEPVKKVTRDLKPEPLEVKLDKVANAPPSPLEIEKNRIE